MKALASVSAVGDDETAQGGLEARCLQDTEVPVLRWILRLSLFLFLELRSICFPMGSFFVSTVTTPQEQRNAMDQPWTESFKSGIPNKPLKINHLRYLLQHTKPKEML